MYINGKSYAWAEVEVSVMGVILTELSAIEYKDERKTVLNYGAGSEPISYGYGPKTCSGGITLKMSAVESMQKVAPQGDITLLPPFSIVVSFVGDANKVVTHKILGCLIKGNTRGLKQGDTDVEVKLDLLVGKIVWI